MSFEACEFWLIFFISSSCSFKVDTRNTHGKCTRARFHIILQLDAHLSKPHICCKYESQTFKQQNGQQHLCFVAHVDWAGLPSFSKLRLFSASWSAFLWYSVNRCCSMILSFSSKDTLASVFFLMFAYEMEQGNAISHFF